MTCYVAFSLPPPLAVTTIFELARILHPRDQMEVFWYVVTCANEVKAEVPLGTAQAAEALLAYPAR